jgi:hypothetical protein
LQRNISHLSIWFAHPAPAIAASETDIKREHYSDFSVANTAAEAKSSPVPPVLSGPDQARLSRRVENRGRAHQNRYIAKFRYAHGYNSQINRQLPTLADFC